MVWRSVVSSPTGAELSLVKSECQRIHLEVRISLNLNRSMRRTKHPLNVILNSFVYVILGDFSLPFAAVIRNDLRINLLKHFPPHSQCVATVPVKSGHFKLLTFHKNATNYFCIKFVNCGRNLVIFLHCHDHI